MNVTQRFQNLTSRYQTSLPDTVEMTVNVHELNSHIKYYVNASNILDARTKNSYFSINTVYYTVGIVLEFFLIFLERDPTALKLRQNHSVTFRFVILSVCPFVSNSSSLCQYITLSVHHTVSLSLSLCHCQFIILFSAVNSSLIQLMLATLVKRPGF